MPKNWEARERKQQKRKYGMRVSGRSAFLIEEARAKRDKRFIERTREKQRKGEKDG